ITWFFLFRDFPEEHFAVSAGERDYIVEARKPKALQADEPQDESVSANSEATIGFAEMFRSANLRMLMVQYVAHNFTFFFTVTWFFPYLKDSFSLTSEQAGLYAAAPLLCGVLGNWLAGFTVDRLYSRGQWQLSRRLPASIGFFFGAVGMSLCVSMGDPFWAVVCMCIAIFGSDMILSPSWSTCMDIGGKSAGAVSGAMNMVGNLGAFLTALLFPILNEQLGSHKPFFYFAAALNFLSIFLWFRIRPDRSMAEELGNSA
ncbi:MAG: MFS transporter, partial [Planctomycetota bacterium]